MDRYVLQAFIDPSNQMPDEEAFSLLVRMMTVYDLQGHFLPEMPKLQMRLVSDPSLAGYATTCSVL